MKKTKTMGLVLLVLAGVAASTGFRFCFDNAPALGVVLVAVAIVVSMAGRVLLKD